MSVKTTRPFRILALPLVRIPHGPLKVAPRVAAAAAAQANAPATPSSTSDASSSTASSSSSDPSSSTTQLTSSDSTETNSPLILYHVQQPPRAESSDNKPQGFAGNAQHYGQRALDKAQDLWLGFGAKEKGSWQRKVFERGEKLMDRIEYEEWALKAIHEGQGVKFDKDGKPDKEVQISLLRPTGLGVPPLLPKLHRGLIHRIPYHKKMAKRFLLFSPVTWPFAIIPVIPNFPLFYVLWRAWSHYKAYRGATYLEQLLKAGMIVEKDSPELDGVYKARAASSTPKDGKTVADADPYPGLLITKEDVPALVEAFEMRPNEVAESERAIEQASTRARDAAKVLVLKAEGKTESAKAAEEGEKKE